MADHKGWYSRNLPHFDGEEATQSLTFHLADSLPQSTLQQLAEELKSEKGNIDRKRQKRIEYYLDQGAGSCILRESRCDEIVQNSLRFLDQKNYELRAWCVMPNHVHFLARFEKGQLLWKALHSLKSFTAHELKKLHPEMETIWFHESFDRYIRNKEHYWNEVRYIHNNPVSARLCANPEDFPWSSAFPGNEI